MIRRNVSIPHLKALVERMGELDDNALGGYYPKVRPLVTIEQFFKGSNGNASLWENQYYDPEANIDEFEFWRSVRDRLEVWDVLVSLRQYDFLDKPYQNNSVWVGSDLVVIITSATPDEVLRWFPDGTEPEFETDSWEVREAAGELHTRVFVPSGMKPLFFWYD